MTLDSESKSLYGMREGIAQELYTRRGYDGWRGRSRSGGVSWGSGMKKVSSRLTRSKKSKMKRDSRLD